MNVLRNLESKIAGLVEGTFSRAFRSEVRPVEIARKLAREMEEHKTVSVSRTYAPNEYAVYLSAEDRKRFADYEAALIKELCGYLLEHARSEKLALLSQPNVEFRTDERLELGEFGIQARLVRSAEDDRGEAQQGDVGHTMVYSAERLRTSIDERDASRAEAAPEPLVIVAGRRVMIATGGALIGRSGDCDIVLDDPNISRRHAEIRPSDDGWVVVDLGSTNGVVVNGHRIAEPCALRRGDRLELGATELIFELE